MTRGGKRDGSGRKSTWASGCTFQETKVIRVPAYISDEVLEFAKKLDKQKTIGLETKPIVTKSEPKDTTPSEFTLLIPLGIYQDKGMTGDDLASRLGVAPATIRRTRQKKSDRPGGFEAWCKSRDPESIAWSYNPETKLYQQL